MKRIGIVTFDAFNFGGILQALALQEALHELGFDAKQLILRRDPGKTTSSFLSLKVIYHFLFSEKKRKILSEEFKNDYIKREFLSLTYLASKPFPYDIVISGSDQIWNPFLTGDPSFYLQAFFPENCKKISYATSFGVQNLSAFHFEFYKNCLTQFKHLSVREYSGARLINRILPNVKCEICFDPTLLLTSSKWVEFSKEVKKPKKYLLCYIMPQSNEVQKLLKTVSRMVSKELSLKVVYIGQRSIKRLNPFECNYFDIGPGEFIDLFKDASFVVTNSFHGLCFSSIFKVPVIPILDHKYDYSLNSRITSFLNIINKENLIIYSKESFVFNLKNYLYFWDEETEKILSKKKGESIEYLRNSIRD